MAIKIDEELTVFHADYDTGFPQNFAFGYLWEIPVRPRHPLAIREERRAVGTVPSDLKIFRGGLPYLNPEAGRRHRTSSFDTFHVVWFDDFL